MAEKKQNSPEYKEMERKMKELKGAETEAFKNLDEEGAKKIQYEITKLQDKMDETQGHKVPGPEKEKRGIEPKKETLVMSQEEMDYLLLDQKGEEEPKPAEDKDKDKEIEDLKNEIELKIDIQDAHERYLSLKNDKTKGKEYGMPADQYARALEMAEKTYIETKTGIVVELMKARKKEEALAFLEREKSFDIENKSLSEKVKSGIVKSIERWDNYGKDEKGFNGFRKRLIKMAVTMSMIGAISSISIEKAAEWGTGITASALGGGTTSYLGRKMAIGLGLGSLMELSKSPKARKVMQYSMMAAMGAGAVVVGAIAGAPILATAASTGISMGVSMAIGYGASKITHGVFEKKIGKKKEMSEARIDTMLHNLENGGKLEEIEKEIGGMRKSYENTKIFSKVVEMATGIMSSVAVLGVAGEMQDSQKAEAEIEQKNEQELKEHREQLLKDKDRLAEPEQKAGVAGIEGTEQNIVNPEAIVGEGQGITQAFAAQIRADHDLAQKLGFTGDFDSDKDMAQFTKELAIKTGYIDENGHEVRVAEANKVAYELKIENGQISVLEKTAGGEFLEKHQEGEKFEATPDKGHEYTEGKDHRPEYQAKDNVAETTVQAEGQAAQEQMKVIEKEPEALVVKEQGKIEEKISEQKDTTKPENVTAAGQAKTEISAANPFGLKEETLMQVKEVHTSNMNNFTNSSTLSELDKANIQDTIKEGPALSMVQEAEVKDIYRPLHDYVNKLHEITGLEPRAETPLQKAETNEEYIYRAEMKAAEMGKLDAIKTFDTAMQPSGKEEDLLNKKTELETKMKEEAVKNEQVKKEIEKIQKESNALKSNIKDMERELGDKEAIEDASKAMSDGSKKIEENAKAMDDAEKKISSAQEERNKLEKEMSSIKNSMDARESEEKILDKVREEIEQKEKDGNRELTREDKDQILLKRLPNYYKNRA